MPEWRNLARALHTVALGVWLGIVVMTAAAAAIIFPTVKGLAPTLPAFNAYTGDHWMVLAGKVADRIFAVSDAAQFACAIVAGAGLVLARPIGHPAWRTLPTALRMTALSAAVTALAYQLFVLSPRMNHNLRGYWAAAERGDNAAAEALKAAFNTDHPTATIVLGVLAVIVLAGLLLAAWPDAEPAPTKAAA